MKHFVGALLKNISRDNRGQELLEYALIAGFLVMTWSVASPTVASNVWNAFSRISNTLALTSGESLPPRS